MAPAAGRFLRDHAFLVAATALPIFVVAFFLVSTLIPRYTVPPPAYDLLLRTMTYDSPRPAVSVEFFVRDEQLVATIRPVKEPGSIARATLWRFDHATSTVSEVGVELPELAPADPPQTIAVEALRGRRVVTQTMAPDGYELRSRRHGSPGVIGELFGMGRYDQSVSIVKDGRVVPIALPGRNSYDSPTFVGWVIGATGR